MGHSGTTVTELVYRHQLRPVIRPARPSWIVCSRPGLAQRSQAFSQAIAPNRPAWRSEAGADLGGRYWVRTSDLFGVKHARWASMRMPGAPNASRIVQARSPISAAIVTQFVTHFGATSALSESGWQRWSSDPDTRGGHRIDQRADETRTPNLLFLCGSYRALWSGASSGV